MRKALLLFLFISLISSLGFAVPTEQSSASGCYGLPKTGETKYRDYRDDAYYQAGLPVSGPRFSDNGNGTVTDNATGLMWVADPAAAGVKSPYSWWHALRFCEELDYAGYNDWRMPNAKELQSIVDYGRHSPAIDINFFKCEPQNYWSSTTYNSYNIQSWYVNFRLGHVNRYGKEATYYVRPVRGGTVKKIP